MEQQKKRHFLLSFALLIPIAAWFLQLCLSYGLGNYWCGSARVWIYHTISLFSFIMAMSGLYLGWQAYKLSQQKTLPQGVIALALIFILLISVSDFANFMLEPCQ